MNIISRVVFCLVGGLDECFDKMSACRVRTSVRPSEWLRHMYYDALAYSPRALQLS